MANVAAKKKTRARKGVYVTKSAPATPYAGDEAFAKLLSRAKYNSSRVKELEKAGRAKQNRINYYREDTLLAIRSFAESRNLPVTEVAQNVTQALLSR